MTTKGRILAPSYTVLTVPEDSDDVDVVASTQTGKFIVPAQTIDEEIGESIVAQIPGTIECFEHNAENLYELYINAKTAPLTLLPWMLWPLLIHLFRVVGVVGAVPCVVFMLGAVFFADKRAREMCTLEMFTKERMACTVITDTGLHHMQPAHESVRAYTLDIPFHAIRSVDVVTGDLVKLILDPTEEEDTDGLEFISSGYFKFAKAPKPEPNDANQKQGLQLGLTWLKEPVRFKKLITAMKNKERSKVVAAASHVDVLLLESTTSADNKNEARFDPEVVLTERESQPCGGLIHAARIV